jgi:hypothetical protein
MSNLSADAIRLGMQDARWNANDLWIAAVSIGGALTYRDVERIAMGERPASQAEHDILAAALNDHFVGAGLNHPVLYWREL